MVVAPWLLGYRVGLLNPATGEREYLSRRVGTLERGKHLASRVAALGGRRPDVRIES